MIPNAIAREKGDAGTRMWRAKFAGKRTSRVSIAAVEKDRKGGAGKGGGEGGGDGGGGRGRGSELSV